MEIFIPVPQPNSDPWWKVDLGASRVAAKVIVAYKNQMEGLQVWIGEFRESRKKIKLS